ncbi:hypothetical protein ACLOJK_013200 [Asimina triloba]
MPLECHDTIAHLGVPRRHRALRLRELSSKLLKFSFYRPLLAPYHFTPTEALDLSPSLQLTRFLSPCHRERKIRLFHTLIWFRDLIRVAMATHSLVCLFLALFLFRNVRSLTLSSRLIHRFSDEAKAVMVSRNGELPAGSWPVRGTMEYYQVLVSSDLKRQKLKLTPKYQSLFPVEGSATVSLGNDFGCWLTTAMTYGYHIARSLEMQRLISSSFLMTLCRVPGHANLLVNEMAISCTVANPSTALRYEDDP